MKRSSFRSQAGFSLIEVLVAALIASLVTAAGFEFHRHMSNVSVTQLNVSDMQLNSRNSIQEIASSIRRAGYKIGSHIPFRIAGDTIEVYYSETQSVDTVRYYLSQYSDEEHAALGANPDVVRFHRLFRRVNSGNPEEFAVSINDIDYTVATDSSSMTVMVRSVSSQSDEKYNENDGFRMSTVTETIHIRN